MSGKLIGFIGASGCSGHAPGQPSLYKGKYLDLPTALSGMTDYFVVNAAQAGAWTSDKLTGQDGYWSQAIKLVTMTGVGAESALDVVVIDICSECNGETTVGAIAHMIANVDHIVRAVLQFNKKVVVNGFPDSPLYPELLVNSYKDAFDNIPGVVYVNLYHGLSTSDGVHPTGDSMLLAAVRLVNVLEDLVL